MRTARYAFLFVMGLRVPLFLANSTADGQAVNGAFQGTITDSTGAVERSSRRVTLQQCGHLHDGKALQFQLHLQDDQHSTKPSLSQRNRSRCRTQGH